MKTAKVVANGDVADWVRDLAADGLKEYGYSVETQDDLSDEVPPGALRVVLEVHNVYCKAYSKYEADVSLTARVVDGAGAATEETYMGRATNMNWAASSSGYQKTLRQAMQNCLNATIPDLDKRIASTCPAVSP